MIPSWSRRALAAVIAALLLGGGAAAYVREEATVVTVDDAVREFRDAAPAGPTAAAGTVDAAGAGSSGGPAADAVNPAAPAGTGQNPAATASASPRAAAPAPAAATAPTEVAAAPATVESGVYTYRTEGFEETNAVGGSRHDYPSETPMTVRTNGCGAWTQRWQPLAERWDESELCREAEGITIRRFTTFHEFFKQRQTQEFLCDAGTYVYKPEAQPGQSWKWTCRAGSSTFATTVTHVAMEDVQVGAEVRPAARLRYDSVMTGANRGTQVQERWIDRATGAILAMTNDIDTEADSPFGEVTYVERYRLDLTSLKPRT